MQDDRGGVFDSMSTLIPDPAPDDIRRRAGGCLLAGTLFVTSFIVAWLAAIMLYGLVVEQWEMVRVRREFSYDWAFLYAPLFAFGCGTAAAFWATRRQSAVRITLLIIVTSLIALFAGIILFGLGGLI